MRITYNKKGTAPGLKHVAKRIMGGIKYVYQQRNCR
mgnify:FL=1